MLSHRQNLETVHRLAMLVVVVTCKKYKILYMKNLHTTRFPKKSTIASPSFYTEKTSGTIEVLPRFTQHRSCTRLELAGWPAIAILKFHWLPLADFGANGNNTKVAIG